MTTSTNDATLRLRIKSFKDIEITVPAGSVVAHVKQQVKAALLPDLIKDGDNNNNNNSNNSSTSTSESDRYVRLICKGRLLHPETHPLTDFNVQDGDVVHAVLAPVQAQNRHRHSHSNDESGASSSSANVNNNNRNSSFIGRRRNLQVGPGGRVTRVPDHETYDSDDDDDDDSSIVERGDNDNHQRLRRGFDRLRLSNNGITSTAFRRSEVMALRSYFSRNIDRYLIQNPNPEEPDPMLRRYQAEEDWMAAQGPTSEFRLNVRASSVLNTNNDVNGNGGGGPFLFQRSFGGSQSWQQRRTATIGTERDFIWGFLLGYLLGTGMLIWVWLPTVPHKQKLGLLTGISFSILMGVSEPSEGNADDGDGDKNNYYDDAEVEYED